MKTKILILALTVIIAGAGWTSCKSSQNKDKVEEASPKMKSEDEIAEEARRNEEWQKFKEESEEKIAENEKNIIGLKKKMMEKDAKIRAQYDKKIEKIEKKNEELKERMADYKDDGNEKWESFKREFKHDMDELGNAIEGVFENDVK